MRAASHTAVRGVPCQGEDWRAASPAVGPAAARDQLVPVREGACCPPTSAFLSGQNCHLLTYQTGGVLLYSLVRSECEDTAQCPNLLIAQKRRRGPCPVMSFTIRLAPGKSNRYQNGQGHSFPAPKGLSPMPLPPSEKTQPLCSCAS